METSRALKRWLAHRRLEAVAGAAVFAAQFVILDAFFRGAHAWIERPRLVVNLATSVVLWTFALLVATRPLRRLVVAIAAASVLVVQSIVFRYYHAPLDVQIAASALHAWHDVRVVALRAAPAIAVALVVASGVEYALLSLAHRAPFVAQIPRGLVALAGCAALFGGAPRQATPDVRFFHALSAFGERRAPPSASAVALPPLYADRAKIPNVLFILTESVRADDYIGSGDGATAPEAQAATRGRTDLTEMRAVSSYTAVSLSAVLTGLSQEGRREDILRAPNLFDFAHALRDASGARPTVAYFSAQSETVFETKDVRASVDRFVTVETLRGRDVEDDAEYADMPLDREIVDSFVAHATELARPTVVVLHLVGTHAPYFLDPTRAPFQPYAHVPSWSGMPALLNAYRNAIYEQDRSVARAVRAFVEHCGSEPWLIVFTSDHGEAFGEHGAIHHGQNLLDEQVHVPAWIASGQGTLDAAQASALADHAHRFATHLDILPTLLDVMGLWDNFAVARYRAKMHGRSLVRAYEPRGAIPVTNCTGMFPCPINTWGLYEDDRKLVARVWDGGWTCLALGGAERLADAGDPTCDRLRAQSRETFPLLPNGTPNR